MNDGQSTVGQGVVTFTFNILSIDQVLNGEVNENFVKSSMHQILLDYLAYFKHTYLYDIEGSKLTFKIESAATMQSFTERFNDVLTGWNMSVVFRIPFDASKCNIPLHSTPLPPEPSTCSVTAIVQNTDTTELATKVVSDDDNIITVPNISFTDSDGTVTSEPSGVNLVCTPIAPCDDATVENSDASYSNTVASGGTLVLPDITVTDSDGSTFTQPSVTDVTCTPPPPCADAIVNINSVFWDNVASGATENISVRQSSGSTEVGAIQGSYFRIGDSTAVVKNSVNTVISTTSIKAEDTEDINLPDITVTDSDGSTFTQPSVTNVTCTPNPKDLTIAIPYATSDDTSTVTIIANAVGTISAADTTGLTSVVFTVNAATVTLPFALALSDVLEITYDAAASSGTIILTGTYV